MARNNRSDKRTPVRTISSVMKGESAPRYQPNRRPFQTAEAIKTRPAGQGITSGTRTPRAPVQPITSTVRPPVAPITTTPRAPVAPITSTPKAPVNPITSAGSTKPAVSTPSKSSNPLSSVLTSTLGKTALGAGAGALLGNIFKTPNAGKTITDALGITKPTTGGTSSGTSGKTPSKPSVNIGGTKTPTETATDTPPADTQDWRVDADGRVFDNDGVYMGTMDKNGNLIPAADLTKTGSNETFIPTPDNKVDASNVDKLGGSDNTVVDSADETSQLRDDSVDSLVYTSSQYPSSNPNAIAFVDERGNGYNTRGELVNDVSSTQTNDQYFQDENGNIYDVSGTLLAIKGSDGQYSAPSNDPNSWTDPNTGEIWTRPDENSQWEMKSDSTAFSDNTWTNPDTGEVWTMDSNGSWNSQNDTTAQDNTNLFDTNSSATNDYNFDDNSYEFAKDGGFITMMNKGGLAHFAGGGGMSGVTTNEEGEYTVSYADGSTETYDSTDSLIGSTAPTNDVASQWTAQGFRDNGNGTFTFTDPEDGSTGTVDADGNPISATDPQGNVTGGVDSNGQYRSYANAFQKNPLTPNLNAGSGNPTGNTALNSIKDFITNNPAMSGGAAGALIGSLLSQSGGSNAAPRSPVDISAATAIAPRTTDFGPGMTGGRTGTGSVIVPYEEYAQSDYGMEPDENLYADLGVSGYLGQDQPEDQPKMASGGSTHYTFGRVIDPADNLGLGNGMKKGGLSQAHTLHSHQTNPMVDDRIDFRQGSAVNGSGDGQSDDIPAMLADGEYVMDAELVSMLGNGSNKAGAKILDKFREEIRQHKRSAPLNKIPPKSKSTLDYLRIAQKVK